jgi:hypothetical protein
VGSLMKTLKGDFPWSKCLLNWAAALALPLVHLGFRDDFWLEFDRYLEIERGLGTTFFFLPYKNTAGQFAGASAPKRRAVKYDLAAIRGQVVELIKEGCEVGLHGINAWQNLQDAESELMRIRTVTGQSDVGTRMHWLYWDESSPEILDKIGFRYDSTFGYNDAVGFRAGTTQPFCPLRAKQLLELTLNIQDSAMFYSARMMLSEPKALDACRDLIKTMAVYGGALTVNWHTRSLSPERLWGDFYTNLLGHIRKYRVWFATAREIVDWFLQRRALHFDSVDFGQNGTRVSVSTSQPALGPKFTLRVYHPKFTCHHSGFASGVPEYFDTQWSGERLQEIFW